MKKEIRNVSKGMVQVTTVDERWYARPALDPITGLPRYEFVPSVTWITDSYPKGIGFYKWLADKGWDEAEAIKTAAGDKGSKVHQAIEQLISGKEVAMTDKFLNKTIEQPEELSLEEYGCLMSFVDWFKMMKPIVIDKELTIWNDEHNYAGTLDLIAIIDDQLWVVDFKTSQYVWPTFELQLSAYAQAVKKILPPEHSDRTINLAVLQLGYKRNKANWKWTEIEDQFPLFLAAQQIWKKEHENEQPKQKDYPLSLTLAQPKAESVKEHEHATRQINSNKVTRTKRVSSVA